MTKQEAIEALATALAVGQGGSTYRTLDGQPTGVNMKATAGTVIGWYFFNNASSIRYVKLYDLATAPTQANTPICTFPLPVSGQHVNAFGTAMGFANGLGIRVTTGLADNDTGAPTAFDVQVNLFYL